MEVAHGKHLKMGKDFRRKAHMVAGGHTADVSAVLTYSYVVSRDSVRIAFTIAALNDLKVLACDIQNAFLSAKCREKNGQGLDQNLVQTKARL